ncbi:MAG: diguanylate cyclase [Bacillota bacterium]|nr:diguanylate cyclase [Bacillota bacterium]
MKNINNRYEIVETISSESNTIEYLVLDHLYGGKAKRMCVFEPELSNVDFVKDFERHFIDLKSIQHEGLVNLFEFAPLQTVDNTQVSRKQFYYTYEHTDDRQLVSYLDLDKSEITRVIVEICKVLRFLHYRGFVYKLLSFDHVKIFRTPRGIRVKLTDVAHISIADYRFKVNHEIASDFVAPEVSWGEELSARADVYSLGKIFYYLYFQQDYRLKTIDKIGPINPLNRFILKATSQIHEERHESILHFIAEMSKLLWIQVDNSDIGFYDKLNENTRIIGRDKLIAEIVGIMDSRALKGTKTQAVYVEGEDGSGKSRIIREIHHVCRFNRYAHVVLKPSRRSEEYYCLKSIVRFILNQDDVNSVLLTKYGVELGALAQDLILSQKTAEKLDLFSGRLRIVNRIVNFVVDYSTNKYLVLLVDDAEYLSETERLFFEQLLRHSSNNGCFVVFAGRDFGDLTKKPIHHMTRLTFAALTIDEIAELVKATLGINYYPYQLVHKLMVETQGNAALIRRLLKAYYDRGIIRFDAAKLDWHFSTTEMDYRLDNFADIGSSKKEVILDVSDRDRQYLRILSVLKGDYNMRVMFEMIEVDEDDGYSFLYRADELNLLNQRISDVEYVFSFQNKELQRELYSTLSKEEVEFYNRRAASIYIERYETYRNIEVHLITYLQLSNQLQLVYQYSTEFANAYLKLGLHYQAIEQFEHAKNAYAELGKQKEVLLLSFKIGEHLTNLGRLDLATNQFEFVMSHSEDRRTILRARIALARIFFMRSKIHEAFKFATECKRMAEELSDPDPYFEAVLILCQCHRFLSQQNDSKALLDEALEKAIDQNRKDYFYLLQSEMMNTERHNVNGKEAIDVIDVGIRYFESIGGIERTIDLLDLKGSTYVFSVGDYNAARDCFREASTRASQCGITIHQARFQKNVGDSYWLEGRYEQAVKAYDEAFNLAEEFGLKDIAILALSCYCQSKIANGEYGKANTLLSKLEHELQVSTPRNSAFVEFRLMQIEYYLGLNDIMRVKQLRYQFDSALIYDRYRSFWLKVLDLRIEYKSALLSDRSDIHRQSDIIETIFELSRQVRNHRYAKLLRELILEIMINMLLGNDIVHINRLTKLDDELSMYYNTQLVRFRRELTRSVMNDYTITRINNMLSSAEEQSLELQWKIHYMLGNLYHEDLDYYNAFRSYLYSLDLVSDITNRVPAEHKGSYILNDPYKINLRARLNRMIRHISAESDEGMSSADSMILSVEDFFDTSQINRMLGSKGFEELAPNRYHRFSAHKVKDLMQNLSGNENENFRSVLECMMSDAFAERGFLYFLNEDESISEVISANPEDEPYDVMRLVYSIGNDDEGLCISKMNAKSSVKLLNNEQKALMYFPIFASSNERHQERRKYDMLDNRKKIIAYVFLDSNNVINRFNDESFRKVKSYSNLINLFIDNYNLKKSATMDKLTGVLLRKHLEQRFSNILSSARKQSIPFSVIMLDIDRFKAVNDTYGHRKGDEILTKLGELLVRSTRSTDLVGRYGGEEFILLLPETTANDAFKVGEKIRRTVEASHLMGEDQTLTISLGVATYPEDGVNEEELVEKADQALYYSKNNGRNRTTSWDPILLKSAHRYDRLTGIITGQIATDTRNVQAMLRVIGWMNSDKLLDVRRDDIFGVLLDIVQGSTIDFYAFDEGGELCDAVRKQRGVESLKPIDNPDYRSIERFRGVNAREYFIDWDAPVAPGVDEDLFDWESLIVESFHSKERCGILIVRSPIREKEFDYSNFNFVDSLRPVLERTLF